MSQRTSTRTRKRSQKYLAEEQRQEEKKAARKKQEAKWEEESEEEDWEDESIPESQQSQMSPYSKSLRGRVSEDNPPSVVVPLMAATVCSQVCHVPSFCVGGLL